MSRTMFVISILIAAILVVATGSGCGPAPRTVVRTDSDAGTLMFQVQPGDAQVFVDGVLRGLAHDFDGTPALLEVPGGVHQIKLVAPGYHDYTTQVYIGDTLEAVRVVMKKL